MALQNVIRLDNLPPGSMHEVVVDGTRVLIVRDGSNRVYAVGARCRHAGGPLAEGRLEGHVVTCPWHGSRWDVSSGRALYGPYGIPVLSHLWGLVLPHLPTYLVHIEDGNVQVDICVHQPAPVGGVVAGAATPTTNQG